MNKVFNILGLLGLALLLLAAFLGVQNWAVAGFTLPDQFYTLSTIFLGIFIEAAPFLLMGTLASGFVEVFLDRDAIQRLMPKNALLGAVAGGLLGFIFPVCECGVIPLTRRFFSKGLAPATGIAFLLASPVINPIVVASTYAAYGWGPVLFWRIGLSLFIAVAVGLVFALQPRPAQLLKPMPLIQISGASVDHPHIAPAAPGLGPRIQRALVIAGDEFFEMGRYLIAGSLLAALLQTVVPQTALLAVGSGPLLSVLVMMALAVLLSICSTVDAFVSLAFVGSFTSGSILSFLVFGPMVDIKSVMLYLQVFQRKTVLYIVWLVFLFVLLASVFINLNIGI
ncbi:MAG: permease [Anaerolineales bacterium]|nr:permease [Anaerolineales bacterium]MCW5855708.1 permease [Anaerolineales bacterium]